MPEPINTEILGKYDLFTKVRNSKKEILKEKIKLEDSKNQRGSRKKVEDMRHSDLNQLTVSVRISMRYRTHYNFNLRSVEISQKPFFRFDSLGPTHRNRSNKTPLAIQAISTPHFQYYNEEGFNIAYKTDKIKDTDFVENLIKDINFGFKHFCDESLSYYKENLYPEIIVEEGALNFPNDTIDPLEGINFD